MSPHSAYGWAESVRALGLNVIVPHSNLAVPIHRCRKLIPKIDQLGEGISNRRAHHLLGLNLGEGLFLNSSGQSSAFLTQCSYSLKGSSLPLPKISIVGSSLSLPKISIIAFSAVGWSDLSSFGWIATTGRCHLLPSSFCK